MMGFRKAKLVIGALVAITTLAACAHTASGNDAAEIQNESPVSPLAEFTAAIWGTELSENARANSQNLEFHRFAELNSQCMHDAGFAFDAWNPPMDIIHRGMAGEGGAITMPPSAAPRTAENERRPDDREWVAQFGYGIVNSPTDLSGDIGSADNSLSELELSEAEVIAFTHALIGPPGSEWMDCEQNGAMRVCRTPEGMSVSEINEHRGCQGWAWNQLELETPRRLLASDEFAPLFEAIDQMNNDLIAEITPADADWALCMADAGFSRVHQQSQASALISDALFGLLNRGSFDTNTPQWAALASHEIDMALADYDCRVATDFSVRQAAWRFEVESQFVTEHRAALEALRVAAEQL